MLSEACSRHKVGIKIPDLARNRTWADSWKAEILQWWTVLWEADWKLYIGVQPLMPKIAWFSTRKISRGKFTLIVQLRTYTFLTPRDIN